MMSRRAICVSRDRRLRGVVEPQLASAGVTVEHCDGLPDDTRGAVLIAVDRAARLAAGDELAAVAAAVGERSVASEADKRHATAAVSAWAASLGARRPVVHRLESAVDELLMNAL